MSLFDFTDPDNGAMLGMLQALGQAAVPTRVKMPFGATMGQMAGGAMQGAMGAQQYKQQDINTQMAQRVLDLYRQMDQVWAGGGLPGNAPQVPVQTQAQASGSPAAFGLPTPGQVQNPGGPNVPPITMPPVASLPPSVGNDRLFTMANLLARMPGGAAAAGEYLKAALAKQLPNAAGGLSPVAGSYPGSNAINESALNEYLGSHGMVGGPSTGTEASMAPGVLGSLGQTSATQAGAAAQAETPFKVFQARQAALASGQQERQTAETKALLERGTEKYKAGLDIIRN